MSVGATTDQIGDTDPTSASTPSTPRKSLLSRARGREYLLILLVPVVLVCLPFWPGHMNADTLNEIEQVMTGKLTDYHAPILLGIWHLFWGAGVGPGWVLVVQVGCFVLGAYLLMRLAFGRVGATVAAAVVTLLPQDYGELGLVGRDAWYTALLMLSAGALAWGFRGPAPLRRRRQVSAVAVSLAAAWFALSARENAVTSLVVIAGAAIVLAQLPRWRSPAQRLAGHLKRLAIVVLGAIVVTVVLYASMSAVQDVMAVQRVHPEQYIYDFDLAGMSVRENRDLFPRSIVPPSRLRALKRDFSLDDIIPELLADNHPLPAQMLNARQVAAERSAEITAVENGPFTWFGLHWEEFLRQVSITREANVIMHPGIDGNSFGYHASFPRLDNAARGYVESFDQTNLPDPEGGIIFEVWIYLLLAVLGLIVLRRWRDPRRLLLGALALSSLTYQVGVFVSMGVQYRLELPSVATGLIVLLIGGRMLVSGWRRSGLPQAGIDRERGAAER